MRTIIESMWYGNICSNDACNRLSGEEKELMGYISKHRENLQSTLTDRQKEIFERLEDCYEELSDINEREIFSYAFRLGARIAVEVMSLKVE